MHAPVLLQQPFGQDVASQTQVPLAVSQRWPVPQARHAAPPAPHVAVVAVTQWPAEQQPVAHVVALQEHTPAEHCSPGLQAEHACPPLPQAAALVAVTHTPLLSQQPLAQVVGEQAGGGPPSVPAPPVPAPPSVDGWSEPPMPPWPPVPVAPPCPAPPPVPPWPEPPLPVLPPPPSGTWPLR